MTPPDIARFLAVVALLLGFGALAGGRLRPLLHAGQTAAVALAALWQATSGADPAAAAVVVVLLAQIVWLLPALQRGALPPAPAPLAMTGIGVLLVVVATACAPAGVAPALAIVLLGLLGAATGAAPFGMLCLLNGAMLALLQAPRLPLQPLLALGLSALAVLAAGVGWPRFRR